MLMRAISMFMWPVKRRMSSDVAWPASARAKMVSASCSDMASVYGVSTPLSVEVAPMLLKKARRSSSAVTSPLAVVISRPTTAPNAARFAFHAGRPRLVTASGRKVGLTTPDQPDSRMAL